MPPLLSIETALFATVTELLALLAYRAALWLSNL